jgi:hypothetical protein
LVVGILALVTLPALLAFAAVNYRSPDLPPGPASYNPVPLHRVPVLTALQSRELQRSRRITGLAPTFTAPTLVPPTFPEPVPTIVLPPRATAYDLSEVRNSAAGSLRGRPATRCCSRRASRSRPARS